MRALSVKTQNMGVKRGVYTAASHVPEANLDMFFISAPNTTAGGECVLQWKGRSFFQIHH